jgi:hypothetical protein
VTDNELPPITAPSPASDQALSAVRSLVLAISVITAFAGFLSKRDLAGFIVYIQSNDFLAFLSVALGIGSLWWGQWKIRHRAKQLVAIRDDPRVPSDVVQ